MSINASYDDSKERDVAAVSIQILPAVHCIAQTLIPNPENDSPLAADHKTTMAMHGKVQKIVISGAN